MALFLAAFLIPGIRVEGNAWIAYAVMAVILGLVNAIVRPILKLLTCPLIVLTLGLFVLVINGVTLWLALRWSGNGHSWDDRHRLALFAGFLGFFVYFCFDKDFERWEGASIVGLTTIIALWRLGRSVAHRVQFQSEDRQSLQDNAG